MHKSTKAVLSINRAIDTLMGRNPRLRREFYRSTKERVGRIWISVGADEDERQKLHSRREQERTRRYVPVVPHACDLAAILWDPDRGRSLANKWFRR